MIYYSTENVALYKYYPKENQSWVKLKDAKKLEAENAALKTELANLKKIERDRWENAKEVFGL